MKLIIQKALGLIFIVLSIITLITAADAAAIVLILAPIGVVLLVSNKTTFECEKYTCNTDYYKE